MLGSIYSIDIIIPYWSYNIPEIFNHITVYRTVSTSRMYEKTKVLSFYFNYDIGKFGLIKFLN